VPMSGSSLEVFVVGDSVVLSRDLRASQATLSALAEISFGFTHQSPIVFSPPKNLSPRRNSSFG
jgi:hypothetical protein